MFFIDYSSYFVLFLPSKTQAAGQAKYSGSQSISRSKEQTLFYSYRQNKRDTELLWDFPLSDQPKSWCGSFIVGVGVRRV